MSNGSRALVVFPSADKLGAAWEQWSRTQKYVRTFESVEPQGVFDLLVCFGGHQLLGEIVRQGESGGSFVNAAVYQIGASSSGYVDRLLRSGFAGYLGWKICPRFVCRDAEEGRFEEIFVGTLDVILRGGSLGDALERSQTAWIKLANELLNKGGSSMLNGMFAQEAFNSMDLVGDPKWRLNGRPQIAVIDSMFVSPIRHAQIIDITPILAEWLSLMLKLPGCLQRSLRNW